MEPDYQTKSKIQFSDSPSIDAFGRARVSSPETVFDSKQLFSKLPLLWAEKLISGGTSVHNPDLAATVLTASSTIGSSVIRQTRQYFNYQPGKSQAVLMTGNFNGFEEGVVKRIGYFDGYNGLFFENDGTRLAVVIRSSTGGIVDDNKVYQEDWNIDTMQDQFGLSGKVLDLTQSQIFHFDFEWLGVGRVRWAFVIDGMTYYCHQSLHANILPDVYMSTPNLPLRYEITNVSGTGGSLKHICSTLFSEGGFNPEGLNFTASNVALGKSVAANLIPLVSIRKKSSRYFRGAMISIENIAIASTTTANLYWQLVINPTVTGGTAATWTSVNAESGIELEVARTGTVSAGTVVKSGYVSAKTDSIEVNLSSKIGLGYDVDYVPDELMLCVVRTDAGAADTVFGSINWRELS